MSFDMSDYVDVAERIRVFITKYPDGCLQGEGEFVRDEAGGILGYIYKAYAYRDPADTRPGIGTAFEPIPGKTPYTKDSEVMNAETSAWGRAIVALGFETKKVASANEVRNRQQNGSLVSESAPGGGVVDSDPSDPVITFGKHKGKKLSETPTDYRQWLVENFTPKDEHGGIILEAAKDSLIPFEVRHGA